MKRSKRKVRANKSAQKNIAIIAHANESNGAATKQWGMAQAYRLTVLDIVLCVCVWPAMYYFGYFDNPSILDRMGHEFPLIFFTMLISMVFLRLLLQLDLVNINVPLNLRWNLLWRISTIIFLLAVIIYPPLYLSPFPSHVSNFIFSILPTLGTKFADAASKVISVIVSGVSSVVARL